MINMLKTFLMRYFSGKTLLIWLLLFTSLTASVSAGTYYVENPSVICAAHFKSNFTGFFEPDGDNFVFEFEEQAHRTGNRWGYRYNGVVVGEDASMLLNWPDEYPAGVITILDAQYPCRAFYSTSKTEAAQQIAETTIPASESDEPAKEPVKKSGIVVAELKAMATVEATTNATDVTASPSTKAIDTASDTAALAISIVGTSSFGPEGVVEGVVSNGSGLVELTVDGTPVGLDDSGSFKTSFYIPRSGKSFEIVAFDSKGNRASKSLFIERGQVRQATGPVFASLNPSGKRVMLNQNALALIIGVADYARTPAKATYADRDAQTFYDYAMLKLGIPAGNIKELVNNKAGEVDVRLAVKDWIARSTRQGKSDIFVFFAGHGLANQSGDNMYLLPFDGSPRLLEDSAISRKDLFADIASAKPRSVTVFLDTCYSGATRGTDMLIASRPIAISAKEQSIPEGFTVMTAAAGDQTAKPLEEAKHGMFSYFLMKGMEGDADTNQDNLITAGELHTYVQQNVIQQSSGSQTPELQGDLDRVLVRFQ